MVRQCEEKSSPIGIILLRKGTAEGLGPIEEPEALVEFIASQLQIDTVQKQRLLEEKSLGAVIKLQLTTLQMHIPKLIRARTARDLRSNN